jgi:NADH-quinone oxidoreductase subunit M
MQWAALAVTLITFGLTLHLPFHYSHASLRAWQLPIRAERAVDRLARAIHYHLGVDGLSMWLMVLTGFWRRSEC